MQRLSLKGIVQSGLIQHIGKLFSVGPIQQAIESLEPCTGLRRVIMKQVQIFHHLGINLGDIYATWESFSSACWPEGRYQFAGSQFQMASYLAKGTRQACTWFKNSRA